MTDLDAVTHFENIIHCLNADHGCEFDGTAFQSDAVRCIREMSDAGVEWPERPIEQFSAMSDLTSIYWQIAAGESSQTFEHFSKYAGYTELNDILNSIFEQG